MMAGLANFSDFVIVRRIHPQGRHAFRRSGATRENCALGARDRVADIGATFAAAEF